MSHRSLSKWFSLAFPLIVFTPGRAAAYSEVAGQVRKMQPANWTFTVEGPFAVWKNKDHAQSIVFNEQKRETPIKLDPEDLSRSRFVLLKSREELLGMFGFRDIVLTRADVKKVGPDLVRLDVGFKYVGVDGKPMQATETTWSSSQRVRFTAHTEPLEQASNKRATEALNRLKPNWGGSRSPASTGPKKDDPSRIEAEDCHCDHKSRAQLDKLPIGVAGHDYVNDPNCKGIPKDDLKTSEKDPGLTMDQLYNEGQTGSAIGCGQGVYEAGKGLVKGAWAVISSPVTIGKGLAKLADSKYREELKSSIGYAASAVVDDPVGMGMKLVNAVTKEVVEHWNALPCYNKRAGMAMACKIVADMITGGVAFKVAKLGFKAAWDSVPEVGRIVRTAMTKGSRAAEAAGDVADGAAGAGAGATATATGATAEVANASGNAAANTAANTAATNAGNTAVNAAGQAGALPAGTHAALTTQVTGALEAAGAKNAPFAGSLAKNLDGPLNDPAFNSELVASRIQRLKDAKTRVAALDELRRVDLVLKDVAESKGKDLSEKVDSFLARRKMPPEEKQTLRNCLLKPAVAR